MSIDPVAPRARAVGPRLRRLALALLCAAAAPAAAQAAIIQVEISGYVAWDGDQRANYFNGRLLTANDFTDEQSYARSANRYIGETEDSLSSLFVMVGLASVVLLFDEADALFDKRSDVKDGHEKYDEDFIVLDLAAGTWRGRLYVEGAGELPAGIYDDLSGRFETLVVVPTPAGLALLAAGLGALGLLRHRRRPGGDGCAMVGTDR